MRAGGGMSGGFGVGRSGYQLLRIVAKTCAIDNFKIYDTENDFQKSSYRTISFS